MKKPLTVQFCSADVFPKKWDMSVVENISAGGVKFKAQGNLPSVGKIIQLRIRIPELAPHLLELEAIVLDTKNYVVRVKFIHLSEANKEHLLVVEKMIERQETKK